MLRSLGQNQPQVSQAICPSQKLEMVGLWQKQVDLWYSPSHPFLSDTAIAGTLSLTSWRHGFVCVCVSATLKVGGGAETLASRRQRSFVERLHPGYVHSPLRATG